MLEVPITLRKLAETLAVALPLKLPSGFFVNVGAVTEAPRSGRLALKIASATLGQFAVPSRAPASTAASSAA